MATTTIILIIKAIVFFFAIMQTIIVIRNAGQLAGREAAGKGWSWQPSATLVPTILWTVFWILCQLPV